MDNFIGKEPHKIADIPVLLAGDAKAREFRWSKEDEGKIKAKQTELLEALTAATKQRKKSHSSQDLPADARRSHCCGRSERLLERRRSERLLERPTNASAQEEAQG